MASPSASALSITSYPRYSIQPSTRVKRTPRLNTIRAISGRSRANLDRIQLQPKQRLHHHVENPLEGFSRGRTPWAIRETDEDHELRFDVPGMTKNDVKVWIEQNMLVFKAEKAQQQEEDSEWPAKSFGSYSCRIALPDNIAIENIKAQVRDGVLYITIPKPTITTKTIGIQVE